jgi:endo-1,4-beta-D-glucanase Y
MRLSGASMHLVTGFTMHGVRKLLLILGVALLIIAGGLAAAVRYFDSSKSSTPIVYSNNAMLLELWNSYKASSLEPGSDRTIDHSQPGNITTSEGESYTMLRAVWMDDQTTFDKSLAFSQTNMQRSDHLFSWKYGELPNGSYGIETNVGGNNTASDGDVQIALALLMAYSRWNEPKYLQAAEPIISSIWNEEVVSVNGQPLLTADNLEKNSKTTVVVDPSYCNPAAFKLFAKIDPTQNWTALTNNTYSFLQEVSKSDLGSSSSDNLPPDWIEVNRTTGQLVPNATTSLDTNYGYDAIRVPFWLALDYQWFHDTRDKTTLSDYSYLQTLWNKDQTIDAVYSHSGSVVGKYQDPATYGASIGYFVVMDPTTAKAVYEDKLVPLYSPDKQGWKTTLDYYDDNWAWFGIALTQGALPNLTAQT